MVKLEETLVTVYRDVKSRQPYYRPLQTIIARIRNGNSKALVEKIRTGEKKLKLSLPCICFSGVFDGAREDRNLRTHSGLFILDFDNMNPRQMSEKFALLTSLPYIVCAFVSPSGNGLKAVVHIDKPPQHRSHYRALMQEISGLDESNINEGRVCFESYDPQLYVNYKATAYTRILECAQVVKVSSPAAIGGNEAITRLEKWLHSKNQAWATGYRNDYLFKLASACCRFGVPAHETMQHIKFNYLSRDNDFTLREMEAVIRSAYQRNKSGTAEFTAVGGNPSEKTGQPVEEMLMDRQTREELSIDADSNAIRDVIYGGEVLDAALRIFHHGYQSADSTGIPDIDRIFKWKRGELTVVTGIGNHGKSTFLNFMMLNKSCCDGTKWAVFSPENNPAEEYYHDLTETVTGARCVPDNPHRPAEDAYRKAYSFVSEHYFYIYPKDLLPTPQYIKSRFLELIIKNKVDGVVIDPFNQMANDYQGAGGRDDKYLEAFLADCIRFAVINNVYFVIVAHPHKLRKNEDKSYDCPDVFDLAGGAMWNNKADNILVYHRPNRHKDSVDNVCALHSKKIRRQKIVGEPGAITFEYDRRSRRFVFDDYALKKAGFGQRQAEDGEVKRMFPPKKG